MVSTKGHSQSKLLRNLLSIPVGSTAVSGSDDKTLIVWETKRGLALTSLQMHVPFTHFDISLEVSRVLVQLVDSYNLPVICLHNTPAQYVKLPIYSGPSKDGEGKFLPLNISPLLRPKKYIKFLKNVVKIVCEKAERNVTDLIIYISGLLQ